MNWPEYIIDCLRRGANGLLDDSVLMRLQNTLRRQNIVVTDYSGWDCPQWSMDAMLRAFKIVLGWDECMLDAAFIFARSCDFSPTQNRVLVAISHELHGSKSCVHSNMIDRLPRKARRYIQSALPQDDWTNPQKQDAYLAIGAWLLENRRWIFPRRAAAECSVHGKECFANGIMWVEEEEQRDSPDRPSVWNVSGLTCHAWSAEGKGEGMAHPSALYHVIWHAERIFRAECEEEDGFFFECAALFPVAELIRDRMATTHFCFWVIVDPVWQGFPSRRRRVLCFCGNRKTVIWAGPKTQEEVSGDFHNRFSRSVVLGGSSLLCESEDDRWMSYKNIADRRGSTLTVQELQGLPAQDLTELLGPPGFAQRFQ